MPRFYDDYSNTYLTHDSAAGRKQQRRGWKFRENFKLHYEKHLDEWRKGPNGLAAAQQASLKSNPNIAPPLPDGWVEENDEATGSKFYFHEESGRRTWVRPGFRPAPTAARGAPSTAYSRPPPNFPAGGPPSQFQRPPPNMSQAPPNFPRHGMPPPGIPPRPHGMPPPGMPSQFRPPPGVPPPNLTQPPPQYPPRPQYGNQQ